MTRNQIEYNKLLESRRANRASEALTASRDIESARHNLESESISRQSLDEQRRSNQAREAETLRSNMAKEDLQRQVNQETARSNRARESISLEANAINRAAQEETARANRVKEQLQLSTLEETRRANRASESLRSSEIAVKRDNLIETSRANRARELETNRSNVAREVETNRHNVVEERLGIARNATYAADVAGRLIYYNKDHSSKITVAPVQSTNTPVTTNNGYGTSGTTGTTKSPRGGGNGGNTVSVGGYNNETGKTFWDIAVQAVQEQEKNRTKSGTSGWGGGSYGGQARRR